ncbi:unnamed protein product [Polarella glacialis]|uniref:Uncharacterized protein n=1 Tax=Polarella glacialis TaxID=89957 RepID=A0A813E0T0_POLGL|nr:unnamed protein product [Polarella glacialis]
MRLPVHNNITNNNNTNNNSNNNTNNNNSNNNNNISNNSNNNNSNSSISNNSNQQQHQQRGRSEGILESQQLTSICGLCWIHLVPCHNSKLHGCFLFVVVHEHSRCFSSKMTEYEDPFCQ